MQLEMNVKESNFSEKKNKPKELIILTQRDFEIISFVSEMKFASLEDIYEKFFKKLKDGSESKSMWWARERISELCKHEYLFRIFSFNERKAYFLGTKKGYFELVQSHPSFLPVRPVETINFNTFEHDKQLLRMRLDMEANNTCTTWLSDRKISMFPELCEYLDKSYLPDAIITTTDNHKVALELEISRKSKKRYHDKIQNYVKFFRLHKDKSSIFKKVIFFVSLESVKKLIEHETKLYKQFFEIQFKEAQFGKVN
jgi:hypothetical protein